jgi:PilZ domain
VIDTLDAILQANDTVAVLGRDVTLRMLDISASGCLLESASRLEVGTTGTLRVVFENVEYVDDVRIMRCRVNDGSSALYHLGAQFLWTTSPCERSLRRMPAKMHPAAVKARPFEESDRM